MLLHLCLNGFKTTPVPTNSAAVPSRTSGSKFSAPGSVNSAAVPSKTSGSMFSAPGSLSSAAAPLRTSGSQTFCLFRAVPLAPCCRRAPLALMSALFQEPQKRRQPREPRIRTGLPLPCERLFSIRLFAKKAADAYAWFIAWASHAPRPRSLERKLSGRRSPCSPLAQAFCSTSRGSAAVAAGADLRPWRCCRVFSSSSRLLLTRRLSLGGLLLRRALSSSGPPLTLEADPLRPAAAQGVHVQRSAADSRG